MPHSCPRPCGRLATAAVFVSVGVVQFIAGLILLKSKYVYLLSGPDFWTAASNLAVGVLLGMSASVWKDIQKASFKHGVRRNLLASLVTSAMIINSTTAIILILGEGNALLSIQLENGDQYSSTSEILAYSYATSVCSPIVSVVVAIIFLSGMLFRVSDKGMKTPEIKSILRKESINEYNWVFKERQSPPKQDTKTVRKELSFKSLSSSSDDESFSLNDAKLWSNSVHSIDFMNTSSRRGSRRTDIHHLSKIQPESACECGESAKNASETIPHETSRVSFADETKSGKFLKFSPYASQSLLETDSPFYSDHIEAGDKIAKSLSYAEFKNMHRYFENPKYCRKKKRMQLTDHPAFQPSKFLEGYMNEQSFQKLDSPKFYIPRAHARMTSRPKSSTTSDIEVDVHVESESQGWIGNENASESPIVNSENGVSSHAHARMSSRPKSSTTSDIKADVHVKSESQDWVGNENTSESPIVQCEKDVSSRDGFTESVQHKKIQFRRTSTFTQLKNSGLSQPEDRKVCRTSTAGPSSSDVSHLDISDIQNDSVIDQNELYESEEEKDASAAASLQPSTSQMDSNIAMDDSFIDVPQPNELAGEVVKVKVNSLPRTEFHSKLIPVPIPIVSSVKNNPLKRKQKDLMSKATDKFSSRNESHFSSFHSDIKTVNQESHHITANEGNLKNQKYEAAKDATVCEMSPEDENPPSPAQTSGYDSAIFENTHFSGSISFKSNLSSSDIKSPFHTPKRKFLNIPFPRNLDNVHGIGVDRDQYSQ